MQFGRKSSEQVGATMDMPTSRELMIPLLDYLKETGDEATTDEMRKGVADRLDLPKRLREVERESKNMTELAYRLTWTRSALKKVGLIENPKRGKWKLTDKGETIDEIEPSEIEDKIREDRS